MFMYCLKRNEDSLKKMSIELFRVDLTQRSSRMPIIHLQSSIMKYLFEFINGFINL